MRTPKNEVRIFCDGKDTRRVFAIHPKAVGQSFDTPEQKPAEIGDDGIAVVSICGPLEHHRSTWFDSYDDILCRIEDSLRCDETKALILCFDSPGGDAAGATECHRKIRRLRKKYGKPVYSYSNEAAYSAAYEIACAADEIWLPDTGGVGSVGVIATVMSKDKANQMMGLDVKLVTSGARKADSHPDRPLTDDIIERMQERVDYLADIFFNVVAKSREMSVKDVADLEAGVFQGFEAVESGLADGVAGWDEFLSLVAQSVGSTSRGRVGLSTQDEAQMATQKKLLSLIAARDKAQAAVAGAKTDADRTKLFAEYEATIVALADFKSKHPSAQEEEDMKHRSSKAKRAEEEEEEDDDKDDDEKDEEEEEESEEEDDDKDEDTDGGSKSSTDGEEDAEEMKAFYSATTGLYTPQRLVRLCQQVTGQKGIREMFGALDGMGIRVKAAAKVEKKVARLETENRKTRVERMLTKARHEGKITRAQVEPLRAKGMQDPKFLKGFLASLPKIVRTTEDGPVQPRMDARGNVIGMPSTNEQERIMENLMAGLSGDELAKAKADFAARQNAKSGAAKLY